MHVVQKIEDEIGFRLRTKKTQTILNAYFIKSLNLDNCSGKKKILNVMNFMICSLLIFVFDNY